MVYSSVVDCIGQTPVVRLERLFAGTGIEVMAKLEMLNPGGSAKDRPAKYIIQEGLRSGLIHAGTHLIESTSGNLGIALAMVARAHQLPLTCVVDPKISGTNLEIMRRLGAKIDMVTELDEQGGYLNTRVARVKWLEQQVPGGLWLNQYANENNWLAHYHHTGKEMAEQVSGKIDYLFVAVSTTGTIRGLSRRLKETHPDLKVVAIDAAGSVIFGTPPGPRWIPGIGASRVPELFHPESIDEVVLVNDLEAMEGCMALLEHEGILAGGSSGSVVAGIQKCLPRIPEGSRIVTLLPDRGERYMDSVYDLEWQERIRELSRGRTLA
ncbi:2,3-diaminopropionate biosynthesis protein SbnA [Deinococcus roseus]|uniref:N-(2-amino-2-carboxyethyl)-L-glutamate synthase n=1 Tax=Deinococcus roseus TaxID=392414 RepID=A0ABQ2DE55_9DEIO|nr:2,3-diaminopropionate biosynthesis protein SbnA [Deinococcus roseus]GGJ52775.1 putative siderophore biosynthesis protein SbnA [Deinococcus roseus]